MENSSSAVANGRRVAPAVVKAVRVLDAVSRPEGPMTISEIARRVELSKSTVHGLVSALVDEGFLVSSEGNKGYALGPKLVELGTRARDQRILDIAEGQLQDLASRTGETAFFGRLNGNRVIILAERESQRSLNLSAPVGASVPLLAGALGKAYMASLSPAQAARYLEHNVLPRYTEKSVTDQATYLQAVEECRELGYSLDSGEYLTGVSAAARAFSWLGSTYFVWNVGIEASHNDAELRQIGEAVQDAVAEIERRLEDVLGDSPRRKL